MVDYTVYSEGTPNGVKVNMLLEELGVSYNVVKVNLMSGEQKEPFFLSINPNGRIPALVDHTADDLKVWESGSILMYLADKHGRFLPKEPAKRADVINWVMWQMAGQGPMQGQANHFLVFTREDVPYGKKRYWEETQRLYGVLNTELEGKEYIAGGEYTIADMLLWPWAFYGPLAGLDIDDFPNVRKWYDGILAKKSTKAALLNPKVFSLVEKFDVDEAARKATAQEQKAKVPQS